MGKIIVAGSTGYIGKRLVYQLLEQGHEVYALARIKGLGLKTESHPRLKILYGDLRDQNRIEPFPQEIDGAYYLVHSMGKSVQNLREEEIASARHFLKRIEKTNCKQILFLSGIIENEKTLSPHLRSRLGVEKELQTSKIPCTIFRASVIIGSGSASFEIIRDLVEKLPLMIAPKWVKNQCQPIAIRDVLFYLKEALLNPACFNRTFDIGGPEAMTFREVLLRYAAFRKLKRYILDVPFLTPRLSSYWLVLITSVRFSICSHLIESMKQNTRKLNLAIDAILPHSCLSYEEALNLAFQKIAQNEVVSTWMDACDLKSSRGDIQEFIEVPEEGCLKDVQIVPIQIPMDEVRRRIWSIGGTKGWYSMDWAWHLRGLIDKLVGGAGMNRGRKHPSELAVGDTVDFWRVLVADEKKGHVILFAEMKLPGEAWLEFKIEKQFLRQVATFRPKGFLGRLYWMLSFPFHWVIFRNMGKRIAQKN